jgi:hypothetical protein
MRLSMRGDLKWLQAKLAYGIPLHEDRRMPWESTPDERHHEIALWYPFGAAASVQHPFWWDEAYKMRWLEAHTKMIFAPRKSRERTK